MLEVRGVHAVRVPEKAQVHDFLEKYIKEHNLKEGLVVGIGALEYAKLSFVDPITRSYSIVEPRARETSLEVGSLLGSYVVKPDGSVGLHIHVSLGARGETYVGHLISGVVNPLLEVFLVEIGSGSEAFTHKVQR
ncbi:MAG: DNA-binding protein [Desulfurococcaceae archaeon]